MVVVEGAVVGDDGGGCERVDAVEDVAVDGEDGDGVLGMANGAS